MNDIFDLDFSQPQTPPPAGDVARFGGRWRLVGAGLSNVWRYGDLDLPAASGRLLLRGSNGTGKTTALEALWPYLLDLNAAKLAAGKARPTTLKLLMSEGAPAKGRRYGYLWLTFAAPTANSTGTAPEGQPATADEMTSFGVRLQYSPSSTPAVKAVPFVMSGRPLRELKLRNANGGALELEEFTTRVEAAGGQVFAEPEDYIDHLAGRIWATTASELRLLASRLREVRNPTLLGDVSPSAAADALRQSLPGVADEVLAATAEALAESETTRKVFERDEQAATVLDEFARVWTGHVIDVTRSAYGAAREADRVANQRKRHVDQCTGLLTEATADAELARLKLQSLKDAHRDAQATARAIETSDAYRSHGRVMDLRKRLKSEQETASTTYISLRDAAHQARKQSKTGREALDEIIEDIAECADNAENAGAPPTALETLLAHHTRPRATHPVADQIVDPGPGLALTLDTAGLDNLTTSWTDTAKACQAMTDRAALILKDHAPVATADQAARTAHGAAIDAENAYDEANQALDGAASTARSAARQALDNTAHWAQAHPHLRGLHQDIQPGPDHDHLWDTTDLDALIAAEPASVRDQLNAWADQAQRIGETLAAGHETAAVHHLTTSTGLATAAAGHRSEARQLRAGQLLPLPRPHWAGPGEDDTALGTLLEWHPALDATDEHKALLELALADSGLLGAHLHTGAATTRAWQISPTGAVQEHNLTAVLDIAADHPHATIARAILERVALADTAASRPGPAVLLIGRDGTFTAGPLAADPVAALRTAGSPVPAASHVGARNRLTRARARADELDTAAEQLEIQAAAERRDAAGRRVLRDAVRSQAQAFPSRHELTSAEAERATTARDALRRQGAAEKLRASATAAAIEHGRLQTDWASRARSLGVPTDPIALTDMVENGRLQAETLAACATQLSSRLLARLRRVLQTLPDETALASRLADLQHAADSAHTMALETRAELTETQIQGDAEDAARRFEEATEQAKSLFGQLESAQAQLIGAEKHLSGCESNLASAWQGFNDARPQQTTTRERLVAMLAWPPLAQALGADQTAPTSGDSSPLLDTIENLLARRPTASKKTLGERYDTIRADLAQIWTIARTDPPTGLEQLDTFILTHAETDYDPLSAAVRAQILAERAKTALGAAEAAALRDFVIGRLPAAIGTAWAALTDWKKTVNRKMRAAQASSGVGVQVQIALRDDLDAATRTVHQLSCEVGDALRTEAQKEQIGQALQALLAAAPGATMEERLASAVDIRSWADVRYLVERPGPDGRPTSAQWGSRTGLSGGERRLVVLAPMLAAIAANYDRLTPTGLRLVPLDEVPAEVDEHGREGLARYLAELDLDILCTSYLWDGAPGAWDGIDAHDLESGIDGTVVAFPMLIRTDRTLPGDEDIDQLTTGVSS
ncbi:SbcC/MukB-like Walker B domain-containing protein [Kitasatospora sp. NPDC002040]|uniref:SbcC/MukB-like Walker B domain-containing protein n=1 Tax=Kitasatospora sp. NPDC002040 TaxID=3154661 RepID=UPI00331B51A2